MAVTVSLYYFYTYYVLYVLSAHVIFNIVMDLEPASLDDMVMDLEPASFLEFSHNALSGHLPIMLKNLSSFVFWTGVAISRLEVH